MQLLSKTKTLLMTALTLSLMLSGCPSEEGKDTKNTSSSPVANKSTSNSSATPASNAPFVATKVDYKPVVGKAGGKRTITSFSPPKTFNAYLAAETSSNDILGQMYVGLVYTDPLTTEVKPELAESWSVSPDKKTYTVKMKKGLLWSDGKPITADDVLFTYNDIINNPDIPTNSRDGLLVEGKFPKVEKVDDLTIKFTTAKPFVPFERSGLASIIVPKHILASLIKKDASGKIGFNQWGGLSSDPKSLVCNGPFKLKEYIPGQRVILEKNDKYWRKNAVGASLPYILEYITEIVKDQEVEMIKFKAKETDSYFLRGGQDFEVLKPDEAKQNFKITNLGPDDGTLFIMFNLSTAKNDKGKQIVEPVKSAWFKNVKFRQALAHAIDKDTMIKSIYRGLASPQISDISQQNPFYNPNITKYDYDMKKAADMLTEAGFKKGADGNLMDSKGNKVEFSLVTNSGNTTRDAACSIIRADWEKLGIKVNYKPVQFNSMVQQIDETLDWDAVMIGLTGSSVEPHGGINSWRLGGRMHMFNMGNVEQNKVWKSRETSYEQWEKDVIKLWEQAAQEFDREKRKQLYWKAQQIVSDNIPFLYTVNKFALVAARNNIGNTYPSLNGGNGLNTVNWNSFEQFIKE
ncbi:MAG: ABC transporter substrate-binding protein [Candidatus Sericytochromatia bacterium]|nr:ABC transporter substrate-binding protein [Candidatus Sericytochromatia bacterium]